VRRAALINMAGSAMLAIEGVRSLAQDWTSRSRELGNLEVVWVDKIPLDRRHRSKVDYGALRRKISAMRSEPHP
jgi:hypothetical protein